MKTRCGGGDELAFHLTLGLDALDQAERTIAVLHAPVQAPGLASLNLGRACQWLRAARTHLAAADKLAGKGRA